MITRNEILPSKAPSTSAFYVRAVYIGSTAARCILNKTRIGSVHSVFRRVINIRVPGNRLISVVRADVGRGPINIGVSVPMSANFALMGVEQKNEVLRIDDSIIIGNNSLIISSKDADYSKPARECPDDLISIELIKQNLEMVKEVASSQGHLGGLGQLIEYANGNEIRGTKMELNMYSKTALPYISNLLQAIQASNFEAVTRNIGQLIGFGPGLTPSADDLLLGLLSSLRLLPPSLNLSMIQVSQTCEVIASCVLGNTTLISQEFILHAASGQITDPILEIIERILRGTTSEVVTATRRLLGFGGFSGTDIVLGILLGAEILLNEAYELCDKGAM